MNNQRLKAVLNLSLCWIAAFITSLSINTMFHFHCLILRSQKPLDIARPCSLVISTRPHIATRRVAIFFYCVHLSLFPLRSLKQNYQLFWIEKFLRHQIPARGAPAESKLHQQLGQCWYVNTERTRKISSVLTLVHFWNFLIFTTEFCREWSENTNFSTLNTFFSSKTTTYLKHIFRLPSCRNCCDPV